MKIIGIDTGSKGAIVCLDSTEKTAEYMMLPYRADKVLDFSLVKDKFYSNIMMTFVEKVSGRGGWGATQTFQFGCYYGQILGLLSSYSHAMVTPQMWQKIAWEGTSDGEPKERSAAAFARLNPTTRLKKKEDGVIDAFHIARYGMLKYREIFTDDWRFINLAEK